MFSRRSISRGARCSRARAWRSALPLLDAMIPAATALAQHRGGAEAARRILLYPARRDHVEHGVRSGDGPLDAERRRRQTSS